MQGLHCCQNREASESRAVAWKLGGLIILARIIPARNSRATIRRARRRPALLRFFVLGMAGAAGAGGAALSLLGLFAFGLLALLLFFVFILLSFFYSLIFFFFFSAGGRLPSFLPVSWLRRFL